MLGAAEWDFWAKVDHLGTLRSEYERGFYNTIWIQASVRQQKTLFYPQKSYLMALGVCDIVKGFCSR